MAERTDNKSYMLDLNTDNFAEKIENLKMGVRNDYGLFYVVMDGEYYNFFIHGHRGNSFSPVFKCTAESGNEGRVVLRGKFYYRKFTVNYLYFWLFALVAGLFFLIVNLFTVSGAEVFDKIEEIILILIFFLMLFSLSKSGSRRFERDKGILLDFLKEYFNGSFS